MKANINKWQEIYGEKFVSKAGEKQIQIDLIIDRNDNTINLCKIKFYAGKYTIDKRYHERLIQKREQFIRTSKTRK